MSCCSACGEHACACGCGAGARTPLSLYNRPGLDALAYRAGTWAAFRATMQMDLSDAALPALARLRTREADDPAIALLDAWAVGADVLTFYQERIANEGYLRTAIERRSVLELGRLVDYRLRPGVAASVYLAYTIEKDSPPVTIPAGARAQSVPAPGEQMQTFETAEPLESRNEWNALRPRLTRPPAITRAALATLSDLAFRGATTGLKPNDWLVFEFSDGLAPTARQVRDVVPDMARQRTQVTLLPTIDAGAHAMAAAHEAMAAEAHDAMAAGEGRSRLASMIGALRQPPNPQPAGAWQLSRDAATALGRASDVRPQLLLHLDRRLADSFYAAWRSLPTPDGAAQVSAVYAQRVAATRFGYNAPTPTRLEKDADGVYQTRPAGEWPLKSDEHDDLLYLDNAYDGILPGSYAIVTTPAVQETPATVALRRIAAVLVHPRTAYGISGKSTQLTLEAGEEEGDGHLAVRRAAAATIANSVRLQQVYVQSEPLELADVLLGENVPDGTQANRLTLDTAVDGLEAGRWVIVEGQRADVPGTDAVRAAEAVMLAAVEQGADARLPGDTVHSTLVFANQGLAYRYRRDSVTVYANVVLATHGETRHEVLGSGSGADAMQAFVLKQPPLTYVSASTVDGVQSTLVVRVNGLQWHETGNLAFVDGRARRFVTATDDEGRTRVQFGDGAHGARLPSGIANVEASYRNGIGQPGNVQARQISLLGTKPLGVKEVINPLRASGGADAETRDQARRNVPLAVRALDRLVSVADYADFARTFGGVGKAVASRLGAQVVVTVAGAADAPIEISSDLYRNLLQALQRYGDPSLAVRLAVRERLALTLSARVGLAADYAWVNVEPQLRTALLDRFGFERRALAQDAYLSEVIGCLQAVAGVAWVDVDAFDSLGAQALEAAFELAASAPAASGPADPSLPPPDVPQRKQRIPALPARYGTGGLPLAAQLACFVPEVPDTLLLQEAAP